MPRPKKKTKPKKKSHAEEMLRLLHENGRHILRLTKTIDRLETALIAAREVPGLHPERPAKGGDWDGDCG